MTEPAKPEAAGFIAATAMFVEVLVVGIGSLAAVFGCAAAVVGGQNMEKAAPVLTSTPVSGAALAFAYALGVVVDRGADHILRSSRRNLRSLHFTSTASFDQARRSVAGNSHIMAMSDYARSRMRVCRGWLMNSIFLTIAADLVILRFPVSGRAPILAFCTLMGLLLALGFYAAWRNITVTGYKKLAQQAGVGATVLPNQASSVPPGT